MCYDTEMIITYIISYDWCHYLMMRFWEIYIDSDKEGNKVSLRLWYTSIRKFLCLFFKGIYLKKKLNRLTCSSFRVIFKNAYDVFIYYLPTIVRCFITISLFFSWIKTSPFGLILFWGILPILSNILFSTMDFTK